MMSEKERKAMMEHKGPRVVKKAKKKMQVMRKGGR